MRLLAYTVAFVLMLFIFGSCAAPRQGIEGRITETFGNAMPGPGGNKPVSTNILVTIPLAYDEIPRNGNGLYTTPAENLVVKKGRTDGTGNYRINLSPGVYSVLVETKNGWLASPTDENGVLNKITVERKQVVTQNITINERASNLK